MYDLNVLGVLRVTQALLPALRASGDGLVVNIGSTAGRWAYEKGAGYTASKHAVRVVTETLRLELNGEPIRISEVAPGMVRTEEFSLVRAGGDQAAADAVYAGVADPLVAEDVAEAVRWIATLPSHVNIDELVIKPRAQAAAHKVHRV
jgi:NADP-dependent 3-hydroxy acid dehydrogenase YdfG